MLIYFLPYSLVQPNEVDEKDWPFVDHLNRLDRQKTFFRRAFRLIQWNESDFEREHKRLSETEAGRQALAARNIKLTRDESGKVQVTVENNVLPKKTALDDVVMSFIVEFHRQQDEVSRSLSSALKCIAPALVTARITQLERRAARKGYHVVLMESDRSVGETNDNKFSAYLDYVSDAQRLLHYWETSLDDIEDGIAATLWKVREQRESARRSGYLSGEARRATARVSAQEIKRAAEALLTEGRHRREIAGILAKRFNVTSDHVRKLWKQPDPELAIKRE